MWPTVTQRNQHHEQQCRSDNSNKTIVSATLFQEVQRFQRCCIRSEASLQLKLPSVNSPSICEASDSLTTIYHLYSVEAVRTVGSSLAENGTREAEKVKERGKEVDKERAGPFDLAKLSWVELGWVTWTGLDMVWVQLKLLLVWCNIFSARIQSSIDTCTCRSEQRKVGFRVAHNPVWMSWLWSQVVWCHSCLLWGTVT